MKQTLRARLRFSRERKEPVLDIWEQFHDAQFTDLWYANPGPGVHTQDGQKRYLHERFGPRWHAGVWTGPQQDLVCVKHCETNEEAERWLSPGGWTPEEAVRLALELHARNMEDSETGA